jgi:hypothetical protein
MNIEWIEYTGNFETERSLETNSRLVLGSSVCACHLCTRSRSIRNSFNSSRQPDLDLSWFDINRILCGSQRRV